MIRVPVMAAAFAAALLIAAPPETTAGDTPLTGTEIQALLEGATNSGKTDSGNPYKIRYKTDGSMTFRVTTGSYSDAGVWTTDGDQYCSQWDNIRDGAKACWQVIRQNEKEYLLKGIDGAEDYVMKRNGDRKFELKKL